MATELKPGTFMKLCTELEAQARARSVKVLTELALTVEKQAKINASSGAHKVNTPTPASPDTGPAIISGTLRRSITHTPVRSAGADTLETLVGTARGFTPFYSRTPSNKYGYYLEVAGLANGARYPFLQPAFRFTMGVPAALTYAKYFRSGWKHLV